MFDILEDLTRAAIGVVKLPVSVAADVVTMGGVLTDKEVPYTVKNMSDIVENLGNATMPK